MPPRTHIIGLDKPTALPLSGASHPEQVLATQALEHEKHREEAVAEMMVLVALMTIKNVLTGREAVTVEGAIYQFGRGVRAHATIAAHCLPGHLMLNGVAIHRMPDWNPALIQKKGMKALALSSKLRNLFGRTDVVDWSINDVDSWIEKMSDQRGLKFLFARSVQQLLQQITSRKPATLEALKDLIVQAVEHYRLGATYVCEERLNRLPKVPNPINPDPNDAHRRLIAGKYLALMRDGSVIPEPMTYSGFDRIAKDVII